MPRRDANLGMAKTGRYVPIGHIGSLIAPAKRNYNFNEPIISYHNHSLLYLMTEIKKILLIYRECWVEWLYTASLKD